MDRNEFNDKMDSIYGAVRECYGYGKDGDELTDFLETLVSFGCGEMIKDN